MDQKVIRERVRWALRTLRKAGHADANPPERVDALGWSLIVRFDTGGGRFFLKYPRGGFLQEPGLTAYLHDLAPDHAPEIFARNDDLGCWLLRSAGDQLAFGSEPTDRHPGLEQVLGDHAALQRKTLATTDRLFELGAKDVRPALYPRFLDEILDRGEDLTRDQVRHQVLHRLKNARPLLEKAANRLQALNPPMTVLQMDLRQGNIKRDGARLRVIDWGDAGVGPAFLDLVPLFSELEHRPITKPAVADLLDQQLGHWSDFGTPDERRDMHRLCRVFFPLLYTHGLIFAKPSWDPTLSKSHSGLLRFYLSVFANRLEAETDP